MKTLHCVTLLATIACIHGETRIASFDWAELASAGTKLPGKVMRMDGRTVLEVRNTSPRQLQVQLLKIEKPAFAEQNYALRGEIKHAGVVGDGFLEMWSIFAPALPRGIEERYFSRTLSETGPMRKITGSSEWRQVLLPFQRARTTADPSALEVNLVLPGQGTVYLGAFELVEFKGGIPVVSATGAWWSERTGGLIGGLLGTSLGCMAGLISWLAVKGKARHFVLASARTLIAAGCLLILSGMVALLTQQPRGVWFPLVLCGIIIVILFPARLRDFRRHYEAEEMRRMHAADAIG